MKGKWVNRVGTREARVDKNTGQRCRIFFNDQQNSDYIKLKLDNFD